jgi:hypothetical protein
MEVSGQVHSPVVLPPGKEPTIPFGEDAVGPKAGLDAVE